LLALIAYRSDTIEHRRRSTSPVLVLPIQLNAYVNGPFSIVAWIRAKFKINSIKYRLMIIGYRL